MIDWGPIIVALVVAVPGTLVGIATLSQQMKTHSTFNSKMDLLLKATAKTAFADGQKHEKEAFEDRQRTERHAHEKLEIIVPPSET